MIEAPPATLPARDARAFRFGLNLGGGASAAEWADKVARAEDLGYDVLSVSDHLGSQLAATTALAAAATATRRIRLATLVLNNDFRHPALLAKELASVDLLSAGRLEVGIGAGWLPVDYSGTGLPFDAPRVRLARLAEAITILKGLWGAEPFSFSGAHYAIDAVDGRPKPVSTPHPPLLVGGGRRGVLSLAARTADIVGLHVDLRRGDMVSGGVDSSLAAAREKLGWLAAAAPERYATLELHMSLFMVALDDLPAATRSGVERFGVTEADIPTNPHFALGSPRAIADQLLARRAELGVSYYTILEPDRDRFARVLPLLAGR